jgi:hypothetical protein
MNDSWLLRCAALSLAAQLASPTAHACSAIGGCGQPFGVAPLGTVPVNLGGVLLDPDARRRFVNPLAVPLNGLNSHSGMSLILYEEGTTEALPVRLEQRDSYLWAAFEQPLKEGTRYILRAEDPCAAGGTYKEDILLTGGPAEPLPASLGRLTVKPEADGEVLHENGGLCSGVAMVRVVDLTLTTRAPAWAANYRLVVDGKEWGWSMSANGAFAYAHETGSPPGTPPAARPYWLTDPGVFRVWSSCGESFGYVEAPGLSAGKHKVRVRADVLSDGSQTIQSDEVELTLTCPGGATTDPVASDDAGGCSVGLGTTRSGLFTPLLLALGLAWARHAASRRRRA